MMDEIDHVRAREAVQLARADLRKCERELDRHLADEPMLHVANIGRAERRLNEARARLHELERQ